MRKFVLIAICAFSFSLSPALAEDKPTEKSEEIVNRMVKSVNEQNYELIGMDFDPPITGDDSRRRLLDNLLAQHGKIVRIDNLRRDLGQLIFVAYCERGAADMIIWLDNNDKITGMLCQPHKPDTDTSVPEKKKATPPSSPPPPSNSKVKWLILILCIFIGGIITLKLLKRRKNAEHETDK
ncbi:MAG: hypothetical protein PHY02_09810 [Phycisphaerae bacterium]|nr:hypothetical protein [Phycisphaerae bacterium]